MRLLRGLAGALLWIAAALLGLIGVVLCITVILLPVGIPLVKMAGGMLTRAVRLMLPRALAHPVSEIGKVATSTVDDSTKSARKAARKLRKRVA